MFSYPISRNDRNLKKKNIKCIPKFGVPQTFSRKKLQFSIEKNQKLEILLQLKIFR